MTAASVQKEETCRRKLWNARQGENRQPQRRATHSGLPQGKAKGTSLKAPGDTNTQAGPPRQRGRILGLPPGKESTSPEGWDPCGPGSAAGGHNAEAGGRQGQEIGSRPAGAGRVHACSWLRQRGIPGAALPGPVGSAAGSPAPATSGEGEEQGEGLSARAAESSRWGHTLQKC